MGTSYKILYGNESTTGINYDCEISWAELKDRVKSICECSKSLMINIFDIKKRSFICCSGAFKTILGYDPAEIICGGWDFWFNLIDYREKVVVRKQITAFLFSHRFGSAAIYLKYHLRSLSGNWHYITHAIEKHSLEGKTIAFSYICDYTEKEHIDRCLLVRDNEIYSRNMRDISVSSRECEVLKLISNGLSSKQIAHKLCISYHTAVSHRKNLIEKFEVQNTAQLIKRASEFIRL
ncbi:LuxR C-terminal-related transcriptional regulator [Sinomicrobium weinanense]|uniref:LuxR family transcriptional regulator n=1 Tax=Sinomicrobium weinanense TaxID=2842200 RepID=A0A926Q2D2_9FLAO|nr:LuxR C-terminal-related transcriptional regulator [Sinomicrobium weinanense]MBC9794786.1 LuxR family transcriptional regulator [Sinomicrobium weinanense]